MTPNGGWDASAVIGILLISVQFLVALVGWFMVATLRRVDITLVGLQTTIFALHGRVSRLEGRKGEEE